MQFIWSSLSCAIHRSVGIALLAIAFATSVRAAEMAPRVIGYERVYAGEGGDLVAAGQLLLGELNCTSCHAADDRLSQYIERKPAPILDSVGSRVRPQYLRKFLADPQATKPGTTMPNILGNVPVAERAGKVEALVHFLASTGTLAETAPLRQASNRGETLFHSIGCIGCHDPRKSGDAPITPMLTSIPLGTPSRKYTVTGLTQFLENPLAVRPGGRMPHLLQGTDARDVASFLLNDMDLAAGLQYSLYVGAFKSVNDLEKAEPKETGDAETFTIDVTKLKDNFGLRFDGTIKIEKEGEYTFTMQSDDGSRLTIDEQTVIDHDGIHPANAKQGKRKLTAGMHGVSVLYFEASGGEELSVTISGPDLPQRDLAALVVVKEPMKVSAVEDFKLDANLVDQGREVFASLGCASCHMLKQKGETIASKTKAPALAALKAAGGCLAPAAGPTPYYALDARQRTTLTAAIAAAKRPADKLDDAQFVTRSLVRFNCIACHQRGELGGVEADRNPHFQSNMPEMGDEGRLPPLLSGVGAKLRPEWMKTVFSEGAKDRPYMFTRMPRFGLENLGDLTIALQKADAASVPPAPHLDVDDDDKKFKSAGRRLVGSQGFGCIKCHTFADKKSTGIQAISMTTMHKRLQPDWFQAYLINPQAYRPGTRMPAAWPNGQTTLPSVLDGSTAKQIRSIWAYLADGEKATQPVGLVTGAIELIAFDEAIMYRNFIEGAGSRAIGVGYPEKLNLAWDANQMRLALIWHGAFMDANRHWTGRGTGYEPPLGDNVLKFADGATFAELADEKAVWPTTPPKESGYQFRGYHLGEKRKPTFNYTLNDVQVNDYIAPYGDADLSTLRRTLTLQGEKPVEKLYYRAAVGGKIEKNDNGAYVVDDRLTLRFSSGATPIVRESGGRKELLLPVKFEAGKATIVQDYEW